MSRDTLYNNVIPALDIEKEINRWNRVLNITNQPKLSINQTPKQEVWKKNKASLWLYPAVEKKYDVPIFLINSLVNRAYCFDFTPGASVIEILVNAGYDVYLLDWGFPGYEDKDINLEDYIDDYIRKGVQRSLRHSGAASISLVGYCLGGVLAAVYTAIAEEPIRNLALVVPPIDWDVNTFIPDKWLEGIKNGTLNLDRFIDGYGIIPKFYQEQMFKALNTPISYTPYINLLNHADDKRFVEKWCTMNNYLTDTVPFTRAAYKQLVNDFIKDNKLVKGEFAVHGKKVDFRNIKENLLVLSSKYDTLVHQDQSSPIMDLVSSEDKTLEEVKAGHLNIALSGKLGVELDKWLCHRS
ncbi:alpha/beta fold hydrolase [Neobacillus niacini]|uniref:alpha/beta fold hydrolase n=1 Tax=Neobacillus niacini TaxID=86668 RepID=UPI000693ED62|nr:alpha/beta fold hydrolase [Neobacillus niacini]